MPDAPAATRIRLGAARRRDEIPFDLAPSPETRAALAAELGVSAVRKLRFCGTLRPRGTADWTLEAMLGATVVQPCDITLEPVTTRIDEPVTRRYTAGIEAAEPPAEQEMPDDETEEPLPASVDLAAVMAEALALAIPPFPRTPGSGFGAVEHGAPGAAPLGESELKPFAGLKDALKRKD